MYNRLFKRMLDFSLALVGLLVAWPVLLLIAVAIKIDDPGPAIFKQKRVGIHKSYFELYKFRSMKVDTPDVPTHLLENPEQYISRVGKFLRKTSLDELPQFYNILVGDMSLIGTRPPTTDEFEKYNLYYRRRLSMTPGLTGMWQISGRSDISDFDEVVRLDLEYIDNWSLLLDIKILFQTVKVDNFWLLKTEVI